MGGLSPLGSKLYMKLQLETSIYQEVEKLYDELSEYYQLLYPDIEESNRRIAKEIDLKILKPMKAKKILECACGTGHMVIELAKLGYEVTGSDISSKMIEKSISNAKKAGVDVRFIRSNFLDLSANIEEKFDIIICRGNSFSHIKPEDFEVALENMGSALKKGGICYVDIRDYESAIREKPLFEHRAHLRFDSTDVVSFYILDYKGDLRTYNIFFVFFDRKNNTVSHKLITINGYFVFENALITAFKKAGFKDIKRIKLDNEPKGINIYIGIKK